MGFKSVLSKMGLVEEDVTVTKATQPAAPAAKATASFTPDVQRTSYVPTPTLDPVVNQMLQQSLQDNKLSGFDYLKFTSAVEEMKSTGTSEDARFKMAYFTAKQMGVDKNNLLKSGKHYLDVLSQDENDFNAECNEYDKKEIQQRESKIAQIEATMTDLSKQLSSLQQDHATLKHELEEEKSRLESRKTSFKVTLQNFRATIETNIEKINQYLQ